MSSVESQSDAGELPEVHFRERFLRAGVVLRGGVKGKGTGVPAAARVSVVEAVSRGGPTRLVLLTLA